MISLYIHIPLCIRKCAYCDFASFSGRMAQRERYVQAVCREIRAQAAFFGHRRVATVFLGGGTPTLLEGAQVQRILDTVRACFDLQDGAEITMEGNPGTLTAENLAAYRQAGVNRLSLGVQSLDDALLRAIGRIHTRDEAIQAVRMARDAGFDNLNLDLMLGLPGQTTAQWRQTLEAAIGLSPEHLSCYSLILEEGTPLAASVKAGTCAQMPEESAMDEMDALTREMTRGAGYAQYEVSNYARASRACRHNIVYWECLPYLGVGLGAHSDMDGRRFYNPSDWEAYLHGAQSETLKREAEGEGTREERMFERMMMGLRQVRGVDVSRFERDFGARPQDVWPATLGEMERQGMMKRTASGEAAPDASRSPHRVSPAERIALTERGMQMMNGILVRMLEETEDREKERKTLGQANGLKTTKP